mmetsp:Transcript_14365/g.41919  ORF Transcript_14365/g.41919 Transcript_14365/m.41919 type:complete len:204 (+) Transcript_14365:1626-2237(+)
MSGDSVTAQQRKRMWLMRSLAKTLQESSLRSEVDRVFSSSTSFSLSRFLDMLRSAIWCSTRCLRDQLIWFSWRKVRRFAIRIVISWVSSWTLTIFADNCETSSAPTKRPTKRHSTLKRRSQEFCGVTAIEPGVIWVIDQCRLVKYWYRNPASLYLVRPLGDLRSSQLMPVSDMALSPMAYQKQQMTWLSHRSVTTSFVPRLRN